MVQLLFAKDDSIVCSICGYPKNLGYRIDFDDRVYYNDYRLFSVRRENGIVCLENK